MNIHCWTSTSMGWRYCRCRYCCSSSIWWSQCWYIFLFFRFVGIQLAHSIQINTHKHVVLHEFYIKIVPFFWGAKNEARWTKYSAICIYISFFSSVHQPKAFDSNQFKHFHFHIELNEADPTVFTPSICKVSRDFPSNLQFIGICVIYMHIIFIYIILC